MKNFAVWDVYSDTDLLLLNLHSIFASGIVTALNKYSFHTGLCDETIAIASDQWNLVCMNSTIHSGHIHIHNHTHTPTHTRTYKHKQTCTTHAWHNTPATLPTSRSRERPITGLDWTGILKFVFMLRGMQLKGNHIRVWLTCTLASAALIACIRAEELVLQDLLPLSCWVLTDNRLRQRIAFKSTPPPLQA